MEVGNFLLHIPLRSPLVLLGSAGDIRGRKQRLTWIEGGIEII